MMQKNIKNILRKKIMRKCEVRNLKDTDKTSNIEL